MLRWGWGEFLQQFIVRKPLCHVIHVRRGKILIGKSAFSADTLCAVRKYTLENHQKILNLWYFHTQSLLGFSPNTFP